MLKYTLLVIVVLLNSCYSELNSDDSSEYYTRRRAHHTPVFDEDDLVLKRNKILILERENGRLLQDNPFAPTGEIMTTTPGIKPADDVLTIDLINQIVKEAGIATRPANITTNTSGVLLATGSNISALNITLSGLSYSSNTSLGNQSWTSIDVNDYAFDPAWVAASNYLPRLNLTYYYPNQIISLSKQNNSLGTAFNLTFRSVRGFINAVILVNQSFVPSLLSSTVLTSPRSVPVDSNTTIYNVTRSLLQSLFYDFTLSPLTLINGTETKFPSFTLYDLRYRSKNGIYNFIVKSELLNNGTISGNILACNAITINVSTQTVPVLASINLINVDGNFKSVNKTIDDFVKRNLNISNARLQYNSVIVWSNRAGTSILYYLNVTLVKPSSNETYLIGTNYNLTNRYSSILYFRESQPIIPPLSPNSSDFQQVRYLDIVSNSTFANIDASARANYPLVIAGPLVKIQTQNIENQTGYRLTYYGVNGKNVQAAYRPSNV